MVAQDQGMMQRLCSVGVVGPCQDDVGSLECVVDAYMQPARHLTSADGAGWAGHDTRREATQTRSTVTVR